jgi:hypothetical protein
MLNCNIVSPEVTKKIFQTGCKVYLKHAKIATWNVPKLKDNYRVHNLTDEFGSFELVLLGSVETHSSVLGNRNLVDLEFIYSKRKARVFRQRRAHDEKGRVTS